MLIKILGFKIYSLHDMEHLRLIKSQDKVENLNNCKIPCGKTKMSKGHKNLNLHVICIYRNVGSDKNIFLVPFFQNRVDWCTTDHYQHSCNTMAPVSSLERILLFKTVFNECKMIMMIWSCENVLNNIVFMCVCFWKDSSTSVNY